MGDDIVELLGGFIALTLILGVVAFVAVIASFVVVPVGLAGAGTLYYMYNIHLPQKRRREARGRINALYAHAQTFSPAYEQLESALLTGGIESALLHRIAKELYIQEGLQPPILPPIGDDQIKLARYQDDLERFIKAADPNRYKKFEQHLIWVLSAYEPDTDESQMFRSKRKRTSKEIDQLMQRFINDDGLFQPLVDQLNHNFYAENEVMPSASKHDDFAWRYLKDTPLLPLADVDERIGLTDRMYHTYLLGSSGSGKTNLIENIIAHDLQSEEDCCVVVIDSQTQLIDKLAQLDIPNTTHITPKYNLALNLFDVGYDEMKGRGIEGETLINKTVGLLSFVLEGMMWAEFTNPQKTIFQYVIQLVISIPGGNIYTFMDILADGGHLKYATDISQLDENMQRFFEVDFPSPDYKRTREAIRRRMDGLLLNPTFRRLFSATENKIDMFEEMANQKLILIDTNKPMLDDAPSAFFGRLFIALILRASYRRFGAGATKRPVYLIVDEAHEYFDRSISDMLEQARKANIGLVVAHQSISQARGAKGGSNITDPLMVNTATKLIWTSFREDATKFAGSMQVKAEDILNLPQFTFGMHSRKQGFVPIKGESNALAEFPKRDDPQALRREMEERYGVSAEVDDGSEDIPTADKPEMQQNKSPTGDEPKNGPPDVEII
jgi:GTPase SAR1 family protein